MNYSQFVSDRRAVTAGLCFKEKKNRHDASATNGVQTMSASQKREIQNERSGDPEKCFLSEPRTVVRFAPLVAVIDRRVYLRNRAVTSKSFSVSLVRITKSPVGKRTASAFYIRFSFFTPKTRNTNSRIYIHSARVFVIRIISFGLCWTRLIGPPRPNNTSIRPNRNETKLTYFLDDPLLTRRPSRPVR